jgi:inosine-uridine nucleoside N-ribohydrolase
MIKKQKILLGCGISLGMLAVLILVIGPAAPLWYRLGVKPVCIQGTFPELRVVSCPQFGNTQPTVTPLPLPTLAEQAPIPLIVDDDGSPDGMVALLFFLRSPLYEVKAVTVSPGEAHPETFANNLVKLLADLGRADIPVGYGRPTPLEGDNAFPEPWRQASDAFWGLPLPEAPASPKPQPAAQLIVETISKSSQPVAVFISGTHTNLAEALRLEPGIAGQIYGVTIMGGSIYKPGNIESDWPSIHNQVAEWNIWVDPLAASEVFSSGLPLHLVPLDATNRISFTKTDALGWESSGTLEGAWAGKLLNWMLDSWSPDGVYVWDLAAAAAGTDPRLCPEVPLAIDVDIEPGPEQGRTFVTDKPANTSVCLEPDVGQIKALAARILGQ